MNETKKTSTKWIIVIVIIASLYYLVPVGLMLFAIISDSYGVEYTVLDNGAISIDKNKVTIQEGVRGQYIEEREAYYIEGKVTNNTDEDYNYLEIKYALYNESGEILGEASTFIQTIGAGKTWNFKIIYDDIDAATVTNFEYSPN